MNMSLITSNVRMLALTCTLCLLPGTATTASTDWQDDIIYFVLIDRYADGDPGNNQRVERHNPGGYHGGDLKGLIQQLDELIEQSRVLMTALALWELNPRAIDFTLCTFLVQSCVPLV